MEKDDHSKLLANLKAAVKQTTGEEAVVGSFNGYTDTAVIAGTLMNHNCMSYGPESLELAHKPNEFVPYEDVCRVQKVLTNWQKTYCLDRNPLKFPFILLCSLGSLPAPAFVADFPPVAPEFHQL